MKAKDIQVGGVYCVELWRGSSGRLTLGYNGVPVRVDEVKKSPVRRATFGPSHWGGDTRVYGVQLDPATLKPFSSRQESFALAKVLAPWDPEKYRAQINKDADQKETDRRDKELAAKLCNALADLSIGASYDSQGLLIARPSFSAFARHLGIEEE